MEYNFVSTIDSAGRFVIPKRMIRELGWDSISKVNVSVKDTKIIITAVDNNLLCNKCNKELNKEFKYCPYCGEKI